MSIQCLNVVLPNLKISSYSLVDFIHRSIKLNKLKIITISCVAGVLGINAALATTTYHFRSCAKINDPHGVCVRTAEILDGSPHRGSLKGYSSQKLLVMDDRVLPSEKITLLSNVCRNKKRYVVKGDGTVIVSGTVNTFRLKIKRELSISRSDATKCRMKHHTLTTTTLYMPKEP